MLMGQQSGHSEAGSKPLKVDLCSGKTFCELCQTQIYFSETNTALTDCNAALFDMQQETIT